MTEMQILLNWLWQGTALSILVALALRAIPGMNAATRERIWWITLVAVAAMPLAHAFRADAPVGVAGTVASARTAVLEIQWTSADRWMMLVAAVWATSTVVGVARLVAACLHLCRARETAVPLPPDRESRLRTWAALRAQGRSARLVVSAHVHRAAVLGGRRPLIALAPYTVSTLDDEQLDLVVIHEYAHVQRRDDIAVLAQRLISAIAGLHPAVWWIDRALETEREVACDDWVMAHTDAPARYAASLVRLAMPAARESLIAPGAITISQLRTRVVRLMDSRRDTSLARSPGLLLGALALTAAAVWIGVDAYLVRVDSGHVQAASVAAPVLPSGDRSVERPREIVGEPVVERTARPPERPIRIVRPASTGEIAAAGRPSTLEGSASTRTEIPAPSSSDQSVDLPASASMHTDLGLELERIPTGEGDGQAADLLPNGQVPVDTTAVRAPAAVNDSPWGATARAGVTIGQASRNAAVGTAGFVTRLSKSVAGRF